MEPLSKIVVFIIISCLFLVSCSLTTLSVERYYLPTSTTKPNPEIKILGINFFRIQSEGNADIRQLAQLGNYHEVPDSVLGNNIRTPENYLDKRGETVVELIYMPENHFRYHEQTDDYPRIMMVMDVMGYRPATLRELLTVAADYKVPFAYYGKVVAFGSSSKDGHFFYIYRDYKGRRVLASKPVGEKWREFNVLFAVVKK